MADLEGFEEKNQLNSRLAKRDGVLVEEVYKVGGLYDRELTNIVSHLRDAARFAPEPFAQGAAGAGQVVRDRARQRSRGVRHRVGPEPRFGGRHHERLHRGLHGCARHEGRLGRRGLLREPREDRQDSRAGDARAVVRGSPADRSEVSQAGRAGRVRAGDRGGGRSRRRRPDHADRRQPAERSAHPRAVRQQVGHAVQRPRRLRALDAGQLPPGVCLGRCGGGAGEAVGRLSPAS